MKRVLRFALVAAVMFGSGGVAIAEQTKPAPTYEQAILNQWRSLHNKILTMAKDTVFPDDKLGWKPHPDSRSVLSNRYRRQAPAKGCGVLPGSRTRSGEPGQKRDVGVTGGRAPARRHRRRDSRSDCGSRRQ
jgi:hypothetical protein